MPDRKNIRVLFYIAAVVFIICIPVLLLASNIRLIANDLYLHQYEFDKYSVSRETGLSRTELVEISEEMISYLNSGSIGNAMSIFTGNEIKHLSDVRSLIQICYILQWATLGYITAFIIAGFICKRKQFLVVFNNLVAAGSTVSVILVVVIGIAALVDFNWLFILFHHAFFRNGFWVSSGYLPHIYTEGFFSDAGTIIAETMILESLFIGIVAGFFILRRRRLMN